MACAICENLFAQAIYCPRAKYSLKGLFEYKYHDEVENKCAYLAIFHFIYIYVYICIYIYIYIYIYIFIYYILYYYKEEKQNYFFHNFKYHVFLRDPHVTFFYTILTIR